jgi:hypothetical protein
MDMMGALAVYNIPYSKVNWKDRENGAVAVVGSMNSTFPDSVLIWNGV